MSDLITDPDGTTWVRVNHCTCGAWGMPPGPHEGDCGWIEVEE